QGIVTVLAVERVGAAGAAVEAVVPVAAIDLLVAEAAGDRVVAGAALDDLDRHLHVVLLTIGAIVLAHADRDREIIRVRAVIDHVDSVAAVEDGRAVARDEHIVVAFAEHLVVAVATVDGVVSVAALEDVVIGRAGDRVVAAAGDDILDIRADVVV